MLTSFYISVFIYDTKKHISNVLLKNSCNERTAVSKQDFAATTKF